MTLTEKRCLPCEKGAPPLAEAVVADYMRQVPQWELGQGGKEISRLFAFDSYWAGLGFTNAVAWIAQAEKHHPDIELKYKKVKVSYSTHAVGGLSENDFICAAKVDRLIA